MSTYIDLPQDGSGGGGGGVSSLNGLVGALSLVGSAHISIVPSGSTITISTTGLIASINGDSTAAQTLVTGTAGTNFAIVDNGTGQHTFNLPTASAVNRGALSSADWTTFNNKGSVSSVALADSTGLFNITGSPITSSGTLTLASFQSKAANTFLAAPNGSAGAPTFRLIVPADVPTLNQNTTGTASNVTGVVAIANGGTSQITAPLARGPSGLNIDRQTSVNNANYTILSTDRLVSQTGTMSAPRTFTLPLASSMNAGQLLVIQDQSGTVSTTNLISIVRAGADTIDGTTSATLRTPYGVARLYSDGVSAWTDGVTGISRGGTGLQTLPTNGQILVGNSTTSSYVLSTIAAGPGITVTNGAGTIQINNSTIGVGTLSPGLVSDGVDGDVVISVNTTLTRDMDYNSLVVNAGVTLTTAGFTIFVKTSLTVQATGFIVRNGLNGGNSATTAAGAAGAALSGGTTGSSGAGAAGGAGTTGNGGNGATSAAVSGEGGTGGVGGNGGGGNGGATVGGSGGNSGVLTIRYFRNVQSNWKYTLVGTYMPTGVGGAGGAAGGGDGVNLGRGGGGGGSAGGGILIITDSLNNLGTIQAKGGNGGNGGGGALGNVGGGAGGGGGGGGKIMIIANTLTARGTLDVSGGAAGNGSAGAGTGVAGTAGAAGGAGYATTFEASTGTWLTTN